MLAKKTSRRRHECLIVEMVDRSCSGCRQEEPRAYTAALGRKKAFHLCGPFVSLHPHFRHACVRACARAHVFGMFLPFLGSFASEAVGLWCFFSLSVLLITVDIHRKLKLSEMHVKKTSSAQIVTPVSQTRSPFLIRNDNSRVPLEAYQRALLFYRNQKPLCCAQFLMCFFYFSRICNQKERMVANTVGEHIPRLPSMFSQSYKYNLKINWRGLSKHWSCLFLLSVVM